MPDTELAIVEAQPIAPRRTPATRLLTRLGRAFVQAMAADPSRDPEDVARLVGYTKPGEGRARARKYSDLIESARIAHMTRDHMHLPEALQRLAHLVRNTQDEKVELAAIRTVVEIEGALTKGPMPEAERASLTRTMDELVSSLRQAPADKAGRRRARVAVTLSAQAETGGDEPEA